MRVFTAATLLCSAVLIGACSNESGTSSGPGGQDPNGFNVLLGSTFAHPRCQNCHGAGEGNQVTTNHENRPTDCTQSGCHSQSSSEWRTPFQSFSFTGLSANETCVAIKNKFQDDLGRLSEVLKGSPNVAWGFNPVGPQLAPAGAAPPGDLTSFQSLVDQWIAAGANCN